ncbi:MULTISPECIES: replication initiation factor domain-containing protein [Lactobacillus]|jgi:DNA relaxase NicK|uniref:replication initiation factor domain-containing protein n=1 Tax=Lactobacillus TaxID=1578 RepID=UPI0021A2C5AF|nr:MULTISPECIES: replication initiation factor domain-containing protein [Lactobacillus]MCT3541305.1 hypothetical protein [Lactobacillus crispatus]MCT3595197.1 hypothetical protein [Lactobacillus amylovorus]MDB6240228.1 replication initiation factor domain-containing protein [Lactobacillus amylovorus]
MKKQIKPNTKVKIDQMGLMLPMEKQNLKIDELPQEFQVYDSLLHLTEVFGEPELLNYGHNGYNKSIQFGHTQSGSITLMYNTSRVDMGLFLHMTASGKAFLEQSSDASINWHKVFEQIYQFYHGHASRIDIATDFINKGFSVAEVYQNLKLGRWLFIDSVNRKIPMERIGHIGSGDKVETAYVGSRKSDNFLRIYDKKKEQMKSKGLYHNLAVNCNDWVRVEAEVKGRASRVLGSTISTLTTDDIYPYLAGYIYKHWKLVINNEK